MPEPSANDRWSVGDTCFVERDHFGIHIGDDRRMNGMDHFATIRTAAEAARLMQVLRAIFGGDEASDA